MSTPKKTRYAPLSQAARDRLEPYRDLMGKRPDGEIAKLAGLDRRYVVVFRVHNDIPAYRRGSAGKSKPAGAGKPRRFRKSKLDEFRHLMGEVPDGRISELAGCSREAVMRYRKRYGIPAAPRGRQPAAAAPPEPTPAVELVVEPVEAPAPEPPAPVAEPTPADDDLPPELDEVLEDQPDAVEDLPEPADDDPADVLEGYLVTVRHDDEIAEWMVLGTDLTQAARSALALVGERQPGAQVVELRYCADLL